jgi:hypothetical protein
MRNARVALAAKAIMIFLFGGLDCGSRAPHPKSWLKARVEAQGSAIRPLVMEK